MRQPQWVMCGFACAVMFFAAGAHADTVPDPLQFVPKQAEVVAKIENPKHLAKSLYYLDTVQKLLDIEQVRELYDSTNARRFYQLIAYFEKKLGHGRFELLDQLAGGGAVLAVKIGSPPTVLGILQGKNAKVTQQFVQESLQIVQYELDRQQIKQKPIQKKYRDVTVYGFGNQAIFAAAGTTLLFSNRPEGMKAAIDLYRDGDKNSIAKSKALQSARNQLTKSNAAAWLWLDLKAARKIPQVKQGFETASIDPIQSFLFGGIVNVAQRAPYLTVGLYHSDKEIRATIRMRSGRKGMAKKLAYFVPKKGGTLPILHPKDAFFSTSYYLDLKEIWEHRKDVLPADIAKGLEQLEKQAGPVLGGTKLSELFALAGPHQRVVAAYTTPAKYKIKPATQIPSFAVVVDMRDPKFAKHMNSILRGVGFIGALQFNVKIVETKYKGRNVVSYYFPEDKKVAGDPDNVRFNFSPSFTKVGNQFVASSTVELLHGLIDELNKEKTPQIATTSTQARFFSQGGVAVLQSTKNQVITQLILDQGLSPTEANKQFATIMETTKGLGTLELQVDYRQDAFQYDIRVVLGKSK